MPDPVVVVPGAVIMSRGTRGPPQSNSDEEEEHEEVEEVVAEVEAVVQRRWIRTRRPGG